MKRQHKLQTVVIFGFGIFAFIMIVIISLVVCIQYVRKELESAADTAFAYTRSASAYIDGDRIEGYVQTGKKDDYYHEIMDFLNAYQFNSDIGYYYVFIPLEAELIYVWDADTNGRACELGQHEEYMAGGRAAVAKIYRQNPPEEIVFTKDATYGYIASAYSPVFDNQGKPVAVVGVDLFMPDLQADIVQFLVKVIVTVISLVLGAVCIFFLFIKKQVVYPINELCHVSQNMAENLEKENLIHINIHTGNEIEELGNAFGQMYGEVKEYIRRLSAVTTEKERIGAELNVATRIQYSMLPRNFPNREEIEIYASMTPAKEVGGDFYDFFFVDETHLALVVADVSGKGVPAALFMVIGKTLIKDHTRPDRNLGEIFTEVNNLLCASNDNGMFITAFEAVLDLVTGELKYVNAGHEMPFICRRNGSYEAVKIPPGFVLAGMENMAYKEACIRLYPGDRFYQYTDGVTEATDGEKQLYGMERLKDALNGKCRHCSPKETLTVVKSDIDAFVGDNEQFDDITMLCMEYKGSMEA